MTAVLSGISILWVRAVCKIRMASYGSNTHRNHVLIQHFVCTYTHNYWNNYSLYTDILHIERVFYYQRWLFSVLELDVRYDCWVMAPNMHCSVFLISHSCILTITTKLENYRSYMDAQHIEWLLYYQRNSLSENQMMALLPTMHRTSQCLSNY